MVDGYLNFDTKVNTSGFNKGTAAISKQSTKIGGIFKTALGTALGFGIEQLAQKAISGLISISTQAIDTASNLAEVQNVVDTAFGEMAYKCEEFAETAVEQFGMSKLTAKQTASTYMAMAKSMGLSMDNASDMAISVAELTGDVASFYNLDTDTAATKLKSIFTGETETLKDLGVVMTETNLKQYALSQGYTQSYSNMSQAEKVALRYNFVMNSLSDAQGDFARTSNSWANQTRVLAERWKELLGILGQGLIKVLTPVVQVINKILSVLIAVANAFAKTIGKFFGMTTEVKKNTTASGAAVDTQESLAGATNDTADATKKAAKEAKKATASFDELNILSQNTSSSNSDSDGTSVGDGSDMLSFEDNSDGEKDTSFMDKISKKLEFMQPYVEKLAESWKRLKSAWEKFANSKLAKSVAGILADAAESLLLFFPWITVELATLSFDGLASFFEWITKIGDYIGERNKDGVWTTFKTEMSELWDEIKRNAKGTWEQMKSDAQSIWGSIKNQWKNFKDSMSSLGNEIATNVGNAWQTIKEKTSETWGTIKETCLEIWGSIKDSCSEIWDKIKEKSSEIWTNVKDKMSEIFGSIKESSSTTWTGIKDTISEKATSLRDKLKTLWSSVKDNTTNTFGSIKTYITDKFITGWNKAWNGLVTKFVKVWNSIVGIVESGINLIIKAVNWCIKQLNKIQIDVPSWAEKLGMGDFKVNIPTLSSVTLSRLQAPKLASGAVIPPNGEFMAILGDQKHGNNIETPESLLRQIFREEAGNQNVTVVIEGDTSKIFKVVQSKAKEFSYRTGKPAFD
jgi:phage-related protein